MKITRNRTGRGNAWAIVEKAAVAAMASLLASPGAMGQVLMAVVDGGVAEGTATGTLDLRVSNGGAPVQLLGVNLNVQVADGGPLAGGSQLGPAVTGVSLFDSGMLFADNNNGTGGSGSVVPQIFEIGTLSRTGTVMLGTGDYLLARIQFDTTGFTAGQSWTVTLETLNGNSVLLNSGGQPLPSTRLDGQLSITPVPEPAATAALAGLALLGFCYWRRSPRARWAVR